jgi:hypothetical protein
MAGGPAADAAVGTDILSAIARPTDAVKQLRKEIAAAERELAKLVAAGNSAAASSIGSRIKTMEGQKAALDDIIKRQRDMERRNKRALDGAEIFKSVVGANAIRQIVHGELDARGLVGLAIMSERTILKAARELGGATFSRATRSVFKAIPLIGEGISSVMEGWARRQALEKGREHVEARQRAGNISNAEARIYWQSFIGNDMDPDKTLSNVSSSVDKLTSLSREDQRKALADIKWKALDYSDAPKTLPEMFFPFAMREGKLNSDAFMKRYVELLEQYRNAGRIMDDGMRREAVAEALGDTIQDERQKGVVADAIWEAVSKYQVDRRATTPRDIRAKFKLDEEKRVNAVEAQRWLIPSRLEY